MVRTPHRRRRLAAVLGSGLLAGGALLGCAAPSGPAAPVAGPATTTSPAAPTTEPSTEATPADGTPSPSGTSAPTSTSPAQVEAPVAVAEPSTVRAPAIGLSESLVGLGLQADGTLDVPEDPDQAAWYQGGSRPGEPGPTTIMGHVDSRTGPAVFARLSELAPGDTVEVTSTDGVRTSYRVDRVEDVPQDAFPTEAVFGATRDDELRLITCTGPWDRSTGYRDNRVVFATAT